MRLEGTVAAQVIGDGVAQVAGLVERGIVEHVAGPNQRARRLPSSQDSVTGDIVRAGGVDHDLDLAPFTWLFITSISTQTKLDQIPIQWLPSPPTFEHYTAMFDPANPTGALFLAALRNSLVIAGTTTILCLVFGVLAAYALSRFVFPAKNVLIMGMLATRLLPTIALVIPFYVIIVSYIDPIFPMFDTRHNLVILYMSHHRPGGLEVSSQYSGALLT